MIFVQMDVLTTTLGVIEERLSMQEDRMATLETTMQQLLHRDPQPRDSQPHV